MSTEQIAALDRRTAQTEAFGCASRLADYWALTKPEVNTLILITTFAGFCVARPTSAHGFPALRLFHALLGTLLVASGAGALNHFLERRFDAQMRRTARRPLASGRLQPAQALWFGVSLSLAGAIYLALTVNALASLLAAFTLLSYLVFYTPLKRRSPVCTFVGAFPGAMPPLIGWAAARGRLDATAWILYAIVFLWQFPHFMAIAWMYRDDYSRAGYMVLPSGDQRNSAVVWQSFFVVLVLIPVSMLPALAGGSSAIYAAGAGVLGLMFLYYSARFAFQRSNAGARQLLAASIIYLPAVFVLLVIVRR